MLADAELASRRQAGGAQFEAQAQFQMHADLQAAKASLPASFPVEWWGAQACWIYCCVAKLSGQPAVHRSSVGRYLGGPGWKRACGHCVCLGRSVCGFWGAAQARMELEIGTKFAFWEELPYKLAGIGHREEWKAREAGRRSLVLFQLAITGRGGSDRGAFCNISRRLLDKTWNSGPTDPPLVQHLEAFVTGAPLSQLPPAFLRWVGAFRALKAAA